MGLVAGALVQGEAEAVNETEPCLMLVIGKDAAEVRAWMEAYAAHWGDRQVVLDPERLLLVDVTQAVTYQGVDGSRRAWRRQFQGARPETVVLLHGWSNVRGVGLELDLLRATGARIVFGEGFDEVGGEMSPRGPGF